MGRESIDLSLSNLYKCWRLFRRGKVASREIIEFEYNLEYNLRRLQEDLEHNKYQLGKYRQFEVFDNKRRLIKVAPVRDRVVHRLIYEYLKPIFDKVFIYDAWSCRENKGLIGAIKRTHKFLRYYPCGYVWRTDIVRFFDNVNRVILFKIIKRKVEDLKTLEIIKKIIFNQSLESIQGIPIGNLTSQIFANIYLNELDRFVKHDLKVKCYLRYGDDFVVLENNCQKLEKTRSKIKDFLDNELWLEINPRHDIMVKNKQGLKFLGAVIYPNYLLLNKRNHKRLIKQINLGNISSYSGLIRQFEPKKLPELNYLILKKIEQL